MSITLPSNLLQKSKPANQGFTIVELIVVIVVIAILAAITLVAYGAIRDRANNVKTISAVKSYTDILNANYTFNGVININDSGGSVYYCLGSAASYPATANMGAGMCLSGGGATARVSPQLNTALKDYGEISVSAAEQAKAGSMYTRGIIGISGQYLYYMLKGVSQDCPMGAPGVDFGTFSGYTMCKYDLGRTMVTTS